VLKSTDQQQGCYYMAAGGCVSVAANMAPAIHAANQSWLSNEQQAVLEDVRRRTQAAQ
jgi:hypothetical protein